jgi:hypothetical protein
MNSFDAVVYVGLVVAVVTGLTPDCCAARSQYWLT